MRVISGIAKGIRLTAPEDRRVRPTSDRIKESLFSILHSICGDISGQNILDLFAGTGSLGIEALSRGANSAVFVDNHRTSVTLINANINKTGFSDRSEVILADSFQALSKLADKNSCFDLVFADPPYGKDIAQQLLENISTLGLLAEGALVIIETGGKEELPLNAGNLRQIDKRIYGDTSLTFFEFIN